MTLLSSKPSHWAISFVALATMICGTQAFGQSPDRSFWSRSGPASIQPPEPFKSDFKPDGGRDGSQDGGRADEAARLYADARSDLEAGQYGVAQRRLEVLVARFPTSPLADVARRDLQQFYVNARSTPQLGSTQLGVTQLGVTPPPATVPAARTIQLPNSSQLPQSLLTPAANAAPMASTRLLEAGPETGTPLRDASEDFRHLAGDRIFFADASSDLGGRAKTALEAQAGWLARYPGVDVLVEGHSDDHGSREFNRALAEKRAYAVKLRLHDLGVAADRISVVAFGRERPVADCAEAHCLAQNRRVVTVITRLPPGLAFEITRGPNRTAGVPVK